MNLDLSREWLETNGLGSFASGTVCGANTRRYHALLCLAALPPQNRLVLVNKLDETLSLSHGGQDFSFDLGANIWPDAVHPQGYKYLRHFTADPIPTWTFEIPAAEWNGETGAASLVFEKALWMPHEVQATVVAYRLKSGPTCTLSARAFVSGRDFHGSHHANSLLDTRTHVTRAPSTTDSRSCGLICGVRLQPYPALPPVVFSLDGAFHTDADWYFCFEYPAERERGLDFYEDAWSPGRFEWKLSAENPTATLVTGTQEWDAPTMRATRQKEAGRRRALEQVLVPQVLERGEEADASAHSMALKRLARAADQFIVRRRDGLHTVLAGYPWFGDWGRDTMIALPGLCLANGRTGEALSILLAFSQSMSRGMIPNRFPDVGEAADYNTIDATLWFIDAVGEYFLAAPDDTAALDALYPALRDSIEWHIKGTRFGIRADERDGLLAGGDAHTQLTWMDAKVGDVAFTPRAGKAVEIQALWFNALHTTSHLASQAGDSAFALECAAWARKAKKSFEPAFWNEREGCLFDVVDAVAGGDEPGRNAQIRPNQIFALSLRQRLLPLAKEKSILAVIERDLLTPFGLRSLSPRDSAYRGRYGGDQWSRDSAYHQGTVWTWPIGAFLRSYLRVNRNSKKSVAQVRAWLQPLVGHLDEAGLGSVSEIFDGDAPHAPRGCVAQAWSVSETLRVLAELPKN